MDKIYAKKISEDTRRNYNLIADDFSRTRRNLWPELSFLKEYVENGDKILDLGCGNGRLAELFKDKEIEYIGIDNSEKLIELAKNRYAAEKIRFIATDGVNLPFPENYFDKIFSIAVLHHIPSRELRLKFLSEARRVLKKDGIAVFTVWNLWQKKGIKFQDADALIPQCDFISVNFAQTKDTEKFLNAKRINSLKKNAVVINTAPMELVDIDALLKRLAKNDITFMFDHSDETDPKDMKKLSKYPNCIIYPPMAYITDEARVIKQEMFVSNIENFLKGKPKNVVN